MVRDTEAGEGSENNLYPNFVCLRRVKDPANGVVDKFGFRVSLVASFVRHDLIENISLHVGAHEMIRSTQRPVAKSPAQKP